MSDDECAIREVIATWPRASATGDTAAVLSLMTDDVALLVLGHRPFGKPPFVAAQCGLNQCRLEATSDARVSKTCQT